MSNSMQKSNAHFNKSLSMICLNWLLCPIIGEWEQYSLILKGSSVTVILRPRADGGFLIVGDAYIQGLMDGEAVENGTED